MSLNEERQNFINRFEWKKGGILDLTQTTQPVSIKTIGTITGSWESLAYTSGSS